MEPNSKKVSICIPAYGVPLILKKTLDSIFIQNYKNYEVIISDDSPDSSVAKMISNHQLFSRIRYSHNKIPLGSPENWNNAVLMASGEYIKIMHHDDIFVNENALEFFVMTLDNDSTCDFLFSASFSKSYQNGSRKLNAPSFKKVDEIKRNKFALYERNSVGAPSSTIFRTKAFIPYDKNLKWLVDVDSYISYISANSNIKYICQSLIETTSNANHQVTRECENNKEIEIREYYYIYKKNKSDLINSKNFQNTWFYLFFKYSIFNISDIENLNIIAPNDIDIFKKLIYKYNSRKIINFIKNITNKIAGKLGLKIFHYFFGY